MSVQGVKAFYKLNSPPRQVSSLQTEWSLWGRWRSKREEVRGEHGYGKKIKMDLNKLQI